MWLLARAEVTLWTLSGARNLVVVTIYFEPDLTLAENGMMLTGLDTPPMRTRNPLVPRLFGTHRRRAPA